MIGIKKDYKALQSIVGALPAHCKSMIIIIELTRNKHNVHKHFPNEYYVRSLVSNCLPLSA